KLVAAAGVPERLRLRRRHGQRLQVGGLPHGVLRRSSEEWQTVLPPWPLTSATSQSATWRSGGRSRRTWCTASTLCSAPSQGPSEGWPPEVFGGGAPPRPSAPDAANGPPSPFAQKP